MSDELTRWRYSEIGASSRKTMVMVLLSVLRAREIESQEPYN